MNVKSYVLLGISFLTIQATINSSISSHESTSEIDKVNEKIANVDEHVSKGDSTIIAKMDSAMKAHDKSYQVTIANLEAKSISEKVALKTEMGELKQALKSMTRQIASSDSLARIAKSL